MLRGGARYVGALRAEGCECTTNPRPSCTLCAGTSNDCVFVFVSPSSSSIRSCMRSRIGACMHACTRMCVCVCVNSCIFWLTRFVLLSPIAIGGSDELSAQVQYNTFRRSLRARQPSRGREGRMNYRSARKESGRAAAPQRRVTCHCAQHAGMDACTSTLRKSICPEIPRAT